MWSFKKNLSVVVIIVVIFYFLYDWLFVNLFFGARNEMEPIAFYETNLNHKELNEIIKKTLIKYKMKYKIIDPYNRGETDDSYGYEIFLGDTIEYRFCNFYSDFKEKNKATLTIITISQYNKPPIPGGFTGTGHLDLLSYEQMIENHMEHYPKLFEEVFMKKMNISYKVINENDSWNFW